MIREDVLTGIVRTSAQRLASEHPDRRAEIALRSADVLIKLKALVAESQETNGTALCLHICEPLNLLPQTDDVAMRATIERVRSDAQAALLKSHYRDQKLADPDRILALNREESIAGTVAKAVMRLRILKPKSFGPEWFKAELGQTAYDELREFAYDLESDSVLWERVAAMMPESMRSGFDPREFGEIPDRIETDEQFRAALVILQRRGITLIELRDFNNLASHVQTVQGFTAILEYVERTAATRKPGSES